MLDPVKQWAKGVNYRFMLFATMVILGGGAVLSYVILLILYTTDQLDYKHATGMLVYSNLLLLGPCEMLGRSVNALKSSKTFFFAKVLIMALLASWFAVAAMAHAPWFAAMMVCACLLVVLASKPLFHGDPRWFNPAQWNSVAFFFVALGAGMLVWIVSMVSVMTATFLAVALIIGAMVTQSLLLWFVRRQQVALADEQHPDIWPQLPTIKTPRPWVLDHNGKRGLAGCWSWTLDSYINQHNGIPMHALQKTLAKMEMHNMLEHLRAHPAIHDRQPTLTRLVEERIGQLCPAAVCVLELHKKAEEKADACAIIEDMLAGRVQTQESLALPAME